MTETQKKLAIIVGVIVIALFLFISNKGAGTTIVNQQSVPSIDASIPSVDIPRGGNITINVPGLPSFTPYQFSPISPCMCNGSEVTAMNNYQGPLVEFVTNQGNSGPNIYNYTPSPPPNGGLGGAIWNGYTWVPAS